MYHNEIGRFYVIFLSFIKHFYNFYKKLFKNNKNIPKKICFVHKCENAFLFLKTFPYVLFSLPLTLGVCRDVVVRCNLDGNKWCYAPARPTTHLYSRRAAPPSAHRPNIASKTLCIVNLRNQKL